MPSTAEVVRETGRIVRERPVLDPRNAREPAHGDLRLCSTRVCFLIALDAAERVTGGSDPGGSYGAITNEIEATCPGAGMVEYFERFGAEASGRLCDAVADRLETDHA